MNKDHVFGVGELSSIIAEVLQGSLFQNIYLSGEIQSISRKGNYTYINLIDSKSSNSATLTVVVGIYCKTNGLTMEVGDNILMRGSISYYSARGTVSFWPKEISLNGEGMEQIRLRRLIEKLRGEGLFEIERKKPLPRFVRKLIVVTSKSGAAIEDIRATLKKRYPVELVIKESLVQGEKAAESLVNSMKEAINDEEADLIIITRGGGSKGDLSPFNDETLARLIASSRIPVISAVGHEIDVSISDLVADVRAITPTDAASMVGPSLIELKKDLEQLKEELNSLYSRVIETKMKELQSLILLLNSLSPISLLKQKKAGLVQSRATLRVSYKDLLVKQQINLNNLRELLHSISPQSILERGYAIISKNGKTLSSINDIKTADLIKISLKDGEKEAIIK